MKSSIVLILVMLLAFAAPVMAAEIHLAAQTGDLTRVKELLAEDPELLQAQDAIGSTPLHSAAYNGQDEIVEFLISKGADIHAGKRNGSTPLHGAAFHNHKGATEILIKKGADVNKANDAGFTPFLSSLYSGNVEIVKLLIEGGANINARTQDNTSAILIAASAGNEDIFKLLLGKGADLNVEDSGGENILHYAAYGGNSNIVNTVIDRGYEINSRSSTGTTPLHNAAQGCHKEIVKLLLTKGAEVNVKKEFGRTPLHNVMFNAQRDTLTSLFDVATMLIKNGADVNAADEQDWTPIHIAMNSGRLDVIKFLVKNGADINAFNSRGVNPLLMAVINGKTELAEFLVDKGAGIDLKDKESGRTPLHWAAVKGYRDEVKLLLAEGAIINATDSNKKTPLNYAAQYGSKKVARLLTAKGAKAKNLVENYGKPARLTKKHKDGEATLWYLGHCGWAIKTTDHFLVFDYWERNKKPTESCLSNGHINPAEIADQNVSVFVTHQHRDHYDSSIFSWEKPVDKLQYVFGFQPGGFPEEQRAGYNGQEYEFIGPREFKKIDDMEIHTIRANDAGVGFLVKVDGLTIYHAGDHAGWSEGQREAYTQEIDYLAENIDELDFAFLNVTGCHSGDTLALKEALFYTVEKLSPEILIPTHALDREYVYAEYAEKMKKQNLSTKIICPENRGDYFVYRNKDLRVSLK